MSGDFFWELLLACGSRGQEAVKHPTVHRTAPTKRIPSNTSTVLRSRNLGLEATPSSFTNFFFLLLRLKSNNHHTEFTWFPFFFFPKSAFQWQNYFVWWKYSCLPGWNELKEQNFLSLPLFLSKLYPWHGSWTHNPKIKSDRLYWLSQPGTPIFLIFLKATGPHISFQCSVPDSGMNSRFAFAGQCHTYTQSIYDTLVLTATSCPNKAQSTWSDIERRLNKCNIVQASWSEGRYQYVLEKVYSEDLLLEWNTLLNPFCVPTKNL